MMSKPERRLLLLISDWQTRTLTLGELQERGYDVMALPGLRWGVKAIVQQRIEPALIVVDTRDDTETTPDRVRRLRDMAPRAPLVLIVSAYDRERFEPLRDIVAAFLVRPLTVGDIVAAIGSAYGNDDEYE